MNCFNHSNQAAVGICKSCGKGLCMDCAAALPNGLACKNACEPRVELLNRIIDENERIKTTANVQMRTSALFVLLLGLVFCVFGLLPLVLFGNSDALFMAIMGLIFMIYGALRLLRKSQFYPISKTK